MTTLLARRRRQPETAQETVVLAAVCACTVLVVGFVASINLAVPDLAASSLHPSSAQLLWIVDAYVVLFACLVIPAGALGDRLGRKGVLTAGLLILALGAIVSTSAPDVTIMLVGRVISGAGAAAVLPNGLAVLVHATRPERRPRAIAVWAAMSGAGGVVGNVGGGALLDAGTWRWLFAAVAPVGIGCAAWIARVAPRSDHHDRPITVGSAALLTTGTLALLIGIIEGPGQGWGSAPVGGAFLGATALFIGWTLHELRLPEPMLDPRLFRLPALRTSCLGMLVVFFGMFGFFYLNASILQYGRGFSVMQTGVAIVPLTVPLLLASRLVPRLTAQVGAHVVLPTAFAVTGIGLLGVADAIHRGYAIYAGWLVIVGIGITLALPTLTIAISDALPRERAGVAGGLQATTRELGSALGVAAVGTLLTAGFVHRLTDAGLPGSGGSSQQTVAQALAAHPTQHDAVISAYADAAGTTVHIVAAIVLATGTLVTLEMVRAKRQTARVRP